MTLSPEGRAEDEDMEAGLGEFHPFSPKIAEAQFPVDFKEPRLKDYDGTKDPQVHVTAFKTHMLKKGVSDALQFLGSMDEENDFRKTFQVFGQKAGETVEGSKGHDTENCWTLTNKIEQLIKEGFLGRYVERRQSNRGTRDEGGSSNRGNYNKRRREDGRRDGKEESEEIRGVVTNHSRRFLWRWRNKLGAEKNMSDQ
ncbi:hypothetical protein SESBI_47856 [Sesbania bispinosa]|nr:hypothetical protein SESBI_47856 [Sesbania bispinosa]